MIFQQLKERQSFSQTENEIVDYLLSEQYDLESLTITALAQATYSSNASIIRLCHKLGFSGFRDFKMAFIRDLEQQKLVKTSIDYSVPFSLDDPTDLLMQKMYSLFTECMEQVQASLDRKVLEKIADAISGANRTFLFARGDTELTLRSFKNKGSKIGFFPILATENGEQDYVAQQMNHKDCAFFVSYSGQHKEFDNCVKILRRKGVPILLLTAHSETKLAQKATYCLSIPDLEKEEKIATFYSQIVFHYVLNLLFAKLYQKHFKD